MARSAAGIWRSFRRMVNKGMADASLTARDSPILAEFRAALTDMYGERLERVVLYGSQARGDAAEDSDYDIAVFLEDLTDRMAESNRIALMVSGILSETGLAIHAMPFPAGSYRERTMLMHEIRRGHVPDDGVAWG